ncbi:MAG: hypothetical protein QOH88_2207 [Verrucomicrobiota bacterium]|jgi:hypothetical protein
MILDGVLKEGDPLLSVHCQSDQIYICALDVT